MNLKTLQSEARKELLKIGIKNETLLNVSMITGEWSLSLEAEKKLDQIIEKSYMAGAKKLIDINYENGYRDAKNNQPFGINKKEFFK